MRASQLVKDINLAKKGCLESATKKIRSIGNFIACKSEVDELDSKFNMYEIDANKFDEILVKSKNLKEEIDTMFDEYKQELVGKNSFELIITHDGWNINEVFGSLESFFVEVMFIYLLFYFSWKITIYVKVIFLM